MARNNLTFLEWLKKRRKHTMESTMSMIAPSTGRGGFDDGDQQDDGDDGSDDWDWDKMERRRWNLLKWCKESESMKDITRLVGEFVEKQKSKNATYMILNSKYPPPKYTLQIRYNFDVDMSPIGPHLRKSLERSDLHRPLGIDQKDLYRTLENDDVSEYMTHIICFYLSTDTSPNAGSPFTQAHFGQKKPSSLSNHFSFAVWNRLKKRWDSKVLPQLSELAIQAASSGKIEKPKSWMDVGRPEAAADPSKINMPSSVTVYDEHKSMVLSSVTAMIPFDWNYAK